MDITFNKKTMDITFNKINNVNSLFKNTYIIFLISVLLLIINFGLLLWDILTNKECFVICGGISGLTFICYLVLFYENILKKYNASLKLKEQSIDFLGKLLHDTVMINNYLNGMCNKANEIIEHSEWKNEWKEFLNAINREKRKGFSNKTNDNNPFKPKYNDNSLSLENLKKILKRFEKDEDYEKCQKILQQINEIENKK